MFECVQIHCRYLQKSWSLPEQEARFRAPADDDNPTERWRRLARPHLHGKTLAFRSFSIDVADAAEIGGAAYLGLNGIGAAAAEMKMLWPRAEQATGANIDLQIRNGGDKRSFAGPLGLDAGGPAKLRLSPPLRI